MLDALRRVLIWTLTIGGVSFAAGFFGPMILAPDANQGPLLGIFYTGPIGTLVGLGVGLLRELLGFRATPLQVLARAGLWPQDPRQLLRVGAAVLGTILIIKGAIGVPQGEGRPAAASLVVGVALLWYAAAGRIPRWFRA